MSTEKAKDTIYIDVDEEITGIIDKVKESDHKVIALVLPKRASVFQSIVNLKLLKRSAEKEGKNIVLITSETSVLPIAGVVGLHVAKTLQSKPEIPDHPDSGADYNSDENINAEEVQDDNSQENMEKSVGELAAASGLSAEKIHRSEDFDDTIDIGDELQNEATGKGLEESKSKGNKKNNKKDKNLKVPNFTKFRKILVIGGIVIIALIVLFLIFGSLFNKATINISTKTEPVTANLTLNLDTAAKSLNTSSAIVPAVAQTSSKNSTASVPTTGQVNNGEKASGTITLVSVYCIQTPPKNGPPPVSPNVGFTANGITFLTQNSTTFSNTGTFKDGCVSFAANGSTSIIAQNGGSNGNLPSGSNFSATGSYSQVSGTSSSDFKNGKDNMVNAVSQTDINSATQKITAQDTSSIKQTLKNQLIQAGLVPIVGTFSTGATTTTASPTLGSVGNNVTVTEAITYTMLGVQQSYLNTLVNNNINSQINTVQQSIIDNGVKNAQYSSLQAGATTAQITMQDKAYIGANLDKQNLKDQIAGKKSADVKSIINAYPGVDNVSIKFFPFWVNAVPKDQNKIVININKS
ncbi:MAG: hypothetical protein WCI37_00400 [bacterium]